MSGQEINGTVKRGALSLVAPIVEVQLAPHRGTNTWHDFEIRYKGLMGPCRRDLKDDNRTDWIFCFLVAEAMVDDKRVTHAVILQQSASESHTYERIGSIIPDGGDFDHDFPSNILHLDLWFRDVEDSVVTIM